MDALGITWGLFWHTDWRIRERTTNLLIGRHPTLPLDLQPAVGQLLVVVVGCLLNPFLQSYKHSVTPWYPLITVERSVFPEWLLSGCYQPLGEKWLQRGLPPHDWFVCYPVAAVIETPTRLQANCLQSSSEKDLQKGCWFYFYVLIPIGK